MKERALWVFALLSIFQALFLHRLLLVARTQRGPRSFHLALASRAHTASHLTMIRSEECLLRRVIRCTSRWNHSFQSADSTHSRASGTYSPSTEWWTGRSSWSLTNTFTSSDFIACPSQIRKEGSLYRQEYFEQRLHCGPVMVWEAWTTPFEKLLLSHKSESLFSDRPYHSLTNLSSWWL